jgi:hypothetical protein
VTNRGRTFVAVAIGLALAALAQFVALLMAGAGHGWVTPFWFSPALFVLAPIAFVRVGGRGKAAPGIEIVLVMVGLALDVALYSAAVAEGVDYFWRVTPFNWVWLALWSGWQVALAGKVASVLMSARRDGA